MKKLLVLCVAMILVLPTVSHAGSATSRWDLSIGGAVELDVSWASQSVNQDVTFAERSSGITTSSRDKYSATSWGAGQSRLNFLVHGPDTWGAKTSAFIEFDFRYASSNAVAANVRNSTEDYGLAALTHAYTKWEWPKFSLLLGQTWDPIGFLPVYFLPGAHDLSAFNRGIRPIQATATWQVTKTFSVSSGIMAPYDPYKWPAGTLASGSTIDDGFQRSNWPFVFTELVYRTDVLGKVGPNMLQFGLGGVYGQDKPIAPANFGPVGNISSQDNGNTVSNTNIAGVQYWNPSGYDSSNVNAWMVTGKTFIPIIPEKAPGKLAGSLGMALTGFTGQDTRLFLDSTDAIKGAYAYNRADSSGKGDVLIADYHAPVVTGGWGEVAFYFTDTVWAGFYYGQFQTNLSQFRRNQISASAIDRAQQYIVNLVYDPNPTIRLGLQYSYYTAHWARNVSSFNPANPSSDTASGLKNNGDLSVIRFAAIYYF